MKNIYIVIKILILIVILGGMFYWFEWRPSEIRKSCAHEGGFFRQYSNDRYIECIRTEGL